MSLARIKVWVNGDVLTAPDLNAEINNIISNPVALISPSTGQLDLSNIGVLNFSLENRADAPTGLSTGRLYFYQPLNEVLLDIGTPAIQVLGPSAGQDFVKGLSGSLISNIGSFAALGYQMVRAGGLNTLPMAVSATSSFSVNTQTAGPTVNGRDQAAVFASTDVHFYAISTGLNSTTIAGVASTKAPPSGPTMPAGYNAWTYLCSAKYNVVASAVSRGAFISGAVVQYSTIFLPSLVTAGGATALTSTPNNASGVVPSIATQMNISVTQQTAVAAGGVGGIDALAEITPASTITGTRVSNLILLLSSGVGGRIGFGGPHILLPVANNAPAVYYQNTINTGTSATLSLELVGYTVPNGDV